MPATPALPFPLLSEHSLSFPTPSEGLEPCLCLGCGAQTPLTSLGWSFLQGLDL